MYSHIGRKIKGLARGIFIFETVAAVITGIALMGSDEDLIAIGLLVMFAGPLVAWVSSWLLYGFGELIDKVCDIAQNTAGGHAPAAEKAPEQPQVDEARIRKIEQLRQQGLITEDEYQRAMTRAQ